MRHVMERPPTEMKGVRRVDMNHYLEQQHCRHYLIVVQTCLIRKLLLLTLDRSILDNDQMVFRSMI